MRGETMKGKSKKSTYSTTFGVDPTFFNKMPIGKLGNKKRQVSKIMRNAEQPYEIEN